MPQSSHTVGLLIGRGVDRRMLADFLREAGYAVLTDPPSKGHLNHWRQAGLILADADAARHYGKELLRLKWEQATAFLPLIITLSNEADGTAWLEAGFDDVLYLPLKKAELKARLSVFVRLREQSERRYRAFFEDALVGIYRITPEGRLLMANPALVQLLGYDSFEELVGAEEQRNIGPMAHRSTFRGLESSGTVTNLESSWTRRDGSTIWVLEHARAVYDEAGEVIYWEGTVEDITERKQAERALEEAKEIAEASNRAKSAFLANMSHEIRTPLTSIIGFTSFLAKQVSDEQKKFVNLIERSGKRLMDTLNSLLTLAKLEANSVDVTFDHINVADEAEQVVQLFRRQAEEKELGLGIVVQPEAENACVRLDSGALSSVLHNLISNAVKFTEEGEVEVTVHADSPPRNGQSSARCAHVSVADTGCGIDPDFLPDLFDAFKQESAGVGRSHEGSGLGLSITKQLVELMGGEIDVESERGQGSTFTVSFPLAEGEANAPKVEKNGWGEAALETTQPRVLVVEDNEPTRFLLERLLRDVADVTLTTHADEALDEARQVTYNLVLIDINLGSRKSGIDVLKKLRTMPEYVDVPMVALTAFALPGNREEFLQAGFSHYLSKPFTSDELRELTSGLLA